MVPHGLAEIAGSHYSFPEKTKEEFKNLKGIVSWVFESSNTLPRFEQASKTGSLGQVAEWLKAAARKSCYTTQVVSEVRILPLSASF
jgi:hypothetical protein